MSLFSECGLALLVHAPLVAGGGYLRAYQEEVAQYSHSMNAVGGFDSASISLSGTPQEIEEWLAYGLGRHIRIVDQANEPVWEGFVDEISSSMGDLQTSLGPLTALANRVSVSYSRINTTYLPPTNEGQFETVIAENLDSQDKYGIWEKVVSGGSITAADADYIRDAFLAERAWPDRNTALASQGGGASTIVLDCRGYFDWLSAYVYSQVVASGTVSVYTFLTSVLAATPNAVFSSRLDHIEDNAMLCPAYENNNQFADSLIKKLLAYGDVNGNRMTFGYYGDRVPYYALAPTTVAYQRRVQSNDSDVYRFGGERLWPWRVRPAQWVFLNDYLVGREINLAALAQDPRCLFIESLQFTAPYTLSLTGGKLSTLDQILAQIAGMGISA